MDKVNHSDAELWNACKAVLRDNPEPLEVWRVAKASGMTEERVILALMRETLPRRASVTFR